MKLHISLPKVFLFVFLSCITHMAAAQLSCASGLPPQDFITATQGFFTDTNSATTLTSTVTLLPNRAQFARDGNNLVIVFNAGWNDGNPQGTSPRATVTLLVNNTPYFTMVTPVNNGTVAAGTTLNGATTLPASPFNIAEGFYSYNQTVTLTLPAAVTQILTLTQAFISSAAANSDDAGLEFSAAYACLIAANLSVSKTNGVTSLTAGTTTTYTLTFANSGTFAANNAIVKDVPSEGLSNCSVISCAPAGGASCPATPNNIFTGAGTTLPIFPANSTATFLIGCGVTTTGQ